MAKMAGRDGILYVGLANSSAVASPVANITQWQMSFTSERYDVTAMGNTNREYVQGLPDAQGSYNGFYDDTAAGLFTAASDGDARKFYFYPDNATTTKYFFGTAFFDLSYDFNVAGANAMSGSWAAASTVSNVGLT